MIVVPVQRPCFGVRHATFAAITEEVDHRHLHNARPAKGVQSLDDVVVAIPIITKRTSEAARINAPGLHAEERWWHVIASLRNWIEQIDSFAGAEKGRNR